MVALSKQKCQVPILGDLKYATKENFLGRPVIGYHPLAREVCMMTCEAAHALCEVQNSLLSESNCGLIIYDSYLPLRAVRDFNTWVHSPINDDYELERKALHFPDLQKEDIAKHGYLALDVSRHCFGNAVDVFLVSKETGTALDMGTIFDFFGKRSHVSASENEVGKEAFKNRQILINAMKMFGFSVYSEEFWHFDYHKREVDEPMDFEIVPGL